MIFNFLQNFGRRKTEEKVSVPNVFVVTSSGVGYQYATNTQYNTTKVDPKTPGVLDSIKSFSFGNLSSAIHSDDSKKNYLGYLQYGIYFQTRLGVFALPFVNLSSKTLSDQATRMEALKVRLNNLSSNYLSRLETGLYLEASTNKNLSVSLELGVSNPIRYIESIGIGFRRSIYNSMVVSDTDKRVIESNSKYLDHNTVSEILKKHPNASRTVTNPSDADAPSSTPLATGNLTTVDEDVLKFYVNKVLGISNGDVEEKGILETLGYGNKELAEDLKVAVIDNIYLASQKDALEKSMSSAGLIIFRSRAGTLLNRVMYKLHRFVYVSVRLVGYNLGRFMIQPVIRIGSSIELNLNIKLFQRVIG